VPSEKSPSTNAKRRTILDAVLEVLPREDNGRSAKELHELIVARSLFTFRAADPVAMVRAAVRKHLRTHGGPGQPPARVREVGRDRYAAA
jgi:hypothetical protein